MQQLCGDSNKLALLDSSETNYIPFEGSLFKLSDGVLYIQLG